MQLSGFPQDIFLFAAGIIAAHCGWLPKLQTSSGLRWMALVLPIGFATWLTVVMALKANGHLHLKAWSWQAAVLSLWESFTCVGVCFGLLVLFRERFNSQGRLAKFFSDNAFSVYVFHPPIVIFVARLLQGFSWHPLLKFAVLTTMGIVGSFTLSALVFRRIPLLARIL